MSHLRSRPIFQLEVHKTVEDVRESIKQMLADQGTQLTGQFASNHILLSFQPQHRHFWSPWLNVELNELEADATGCFMFGRFSPHPSIWTGFMFTYLACSTLILFALVVGTAQMVARQTASGFWLVPALLGIILLLWLASQVGKRLAHDQIELLRDQLVKAVSDR